jgi:hypothetical protein
MKKILMLAAMAVVLQSAAFAQNAREATAKFKDNNQVAVVADFMADADLVEEAMKERLAKEGFGKRSSESGYDAYKGTAWGRVSSEKLDVYIKIAGKKGKSTVTMLVAKGYDNFVSSSKDATVVSGVKDFLNSFGNYVATRKGVMDGEALIKKMEEAQAKMMKEKEALEKKVVEQNTLIQQSQAEMNTQKLKIDELKKSLN